VLTEFGSTLLVIAALVLAFAGLALVVAGLVALRDARAIGFTVRTLAGLLLVTLGALAATIALGLQGYRALTHEEVAARISVRPTAPQRFTATVRFADERQATYEIAGDEIYVDAHILKWQPYANVLGLHTAYELDRIGGRYRDIKDEKGAQRTVYPLARERWVDLFGLRQKYTFLAPFVDAEYGSATFIAVKRPAELELRVSTTGLLLRESKPQPK
jgi:hypothetical protein